MTHSEALQYLRQVIQPDTVLYFQRVYRFSHLADHWYRLFIHTAPPQEITLYGIYAVPRLTTHSKTQGRPLMHIRADGSSSCRRFAYYLSKQLYPRSRDHVFPVSLLQPLHFAEACGVMKALCD